MKKFTVPCDFDGKKHPFDMYVLEPSPLSHPLYYQTLWLKEERGGIVPEDVIDSFNRIYAIAVENNVGFAELSVYSLGDEGPPKAKKKGNIIYADFSKSAYEASHGNDMGILVSNAPKEDIHFFELIELLPVQLGPFTRLLAERVLLHTHFLNTHQHQFAIQVFAAILFLIASNHEKLTVTDVWTQRLGTYLGDDAVYNMAVSADALGYAVSFESLATIEYFLRAGEYWHRHIQDKIRDALANWAIKSDADKEVTKFKKFGVEKKSLLALKKTLKTAFHPL